MKSDLKNIGKRCLSWFLCILYLEMMFVLFISKTISWQLCINILFSAVLISQILTMISFAFREKGNVIFCSIVLFLLGALFSLQGVFYLIFKVYFSLYNFALQDQVKDFLADAIRLILKNSFYIFVFLLPFIFYLVFRKKISFERFSWKGLACLFCSSLLVIGAFFFFVGITKHDNYSTYDLYENVNNISLSIKRLGVLNSYQLEVRRLIFGFSPKNIKAVSIEEEEKEELISYKENKLDLSFRETDNPTVQMIHSYVQNDEATLQNEYTGMFKDYNLIYITAEAFSEIGVDPSLTPTLYRLTHSGFVFENFYTPNNLSTIGGEFQSLTGLYPDYAILSRWRSGGNAFPYGLANMFQKEGYYTYAYHDNSYVFQDRNQYLASQGFTNFLACYNGLEKRMNCGRWPQSDDEMIAVTVDDYINSDKPFLAYYMTVSGHFGYTFVGNSISSKNREFVDAMDKSEGAKAYVATQIELDQALNRLLERLEEAGKLDKTVIVLMADHYPYGLDVDAINELSSYPRDEIGITHNSLILWNSKLEKTTIDKPCMPVDVIPTVYNLFGLDYDSRLFTGKDIFSTSFGIAILADRSWITNKGVYYAPSNEFVPNSTVEDGYVEKVNQLVNNRLNISKLIMENNYYWYLLP